MHLHCLVSEYFYYCKKGNDEDDIVKKITQNMSIL